MRVLVTGAASGIGRATCLRLARDAGARGQPAKVAAVDIGPSTGLDSLVGELKGLGAEVLPLHGDMGTADGPARVVGETVARFGGLDGLVSKAPSRKWDAASVIAWCWGARGRSGGTP